MKRDRERESSAGWHHKSYPYMCMRFSGLVSGMPTSVQKEKQGMSYEAKLRVLYHKAQICPCVLVLFYYAACRTQN
jgi:hypothetical protein